MTYAIVLLVFHLLPILLTAANYLLCGLRLLHQITVVKKQVQLIVKYCMVTVHYKITIKNNLFAVNYS